MKTIISLKRMLMISSIVAVSAFSFVGCDKNDDDDNDNMFTVSGSASGSQMVPSVAGGGSATMSGTFNGDTRVLTYTTNWTNLTGGPTTAAFYSGATGVNGTVVGDTWALGTGLNGTGNFSSSITLASDQAVQLTSGNMYYVIGTAANATGEVRGQMTVTHQ